MNVVSERHPASSSILVVLSSPVVVSCYASVMEVVGWVGWVHYPRRTLGEQVTILGPVVVPFPVDAAMRKYIKINVLTCIRYC